MFDLVIRNARCASSSDVFNADIGIRDGRIAELGAIGFRLVIFPGGIVRALARTAQDYYRSLAANGSNKPFQDRMFDFKALNELIGTPGMLARGQEYERFGAELKDGQA